MSETLEKVTQEAFSLSLGERASLAHALIQSLDTHYDSDRDALWDAEIKSRVDIIDSGLAVGKDSSEVFSDIECKFNR